MFLKFCLIQPKRSYKKGFQFIKEMSVNSNYYFLKTIQNRDGTGSLLLVIYNLQEEIRWSLVSTHSELKLPNWKFFPDRDQRAKFSQIY